MARGMVPKLNASIVQGTGSVTVSADFRALDPVLRADLLGDWIAGLEKEKARALSQAAERKTR